MSKLLFVVHRYAPYAGGSEYFIQNMAEECLKRGHDVTVLTDTHQGDLNGVKVTGKYTILHSQFDLILVHGGDVWTQNFVHFYAPKINAISPVCYMIIKPSTSFNCMEGLREHKILAYSTSADLEHIKQFGFEAKARRIRHGVPPDKTIQKIEVSPIKQPIKFVSAGGFMPHKRMKELAQTFNELNLPNTQLDLYGYDYGSHEIPDYPNVRIFATAGQQQVLQAVRNADLYIMNSSEEGFGLVLLEAMMNKTPWLATNIAGAKDMARYGQVYNNTDELKQYMKYFVENIEGIKAAIDADIAYEYVMTNHTISNTVDDIEDIVRELK